MLIDHVEQGGVDDQEDWNLGYFGRRAKGKGKSKGKEGDTDAGKGGLKG